MDQLRGRALVTSSHTSCSLGRLVRVLVGNIKSELTQPRRGILDGLAPSLAVVGLMLPAVSVPEERIEQRPPVGEHVWRARAPQPRSRRARPSSAMASSPVGAHLPRRWRAWTRATTASHGMPRALVLRMRSAQ